MGVIVGLLWQHVPPYRGLLIKTIGQKATRMLRNEHMVCERPYLLSRDAVSKHFP